MSGDSKTVSKGQCANFQASLDNAQKAANNLKAKYGENDSRYTDAQKSINAYGKQGVDNGVTIAQGSVDGGAETVVANQAGAKTRDNPNGQSVTVTFDNGMLSGLTGPGLDAVSTLATHEGVHILAGSAWVSSGFSENMDPTVLQGEHNAYVVQANMAQGFGYPTLPLSFGPRNYSFSAGEGGKIDAMIKREYPRWNLKEFTFNTQKKQ